MRINILSEIQDGLLAVSPLRAHYTRRAYKMLPKLENPCILDVGCGSGVPTLELARLSRGHVIGVDIKQEALDEFKQAIATISLSSCVHPVRGSLKTMCFCNETFNVIWTEGAIWVIGFERGLREWRRLLKPGGYLVVHEMSWLRPDPPIEVKNHWKGIYAGIRTAQEYLEVIPACGYDPLGHFTLPEDAWWRMYYQPMQKRIQELRLKYKGDPAAKAVLSTKQREVDQHKAQQKWYGSAFFLMRKPVDEIAD